MDPLRAALASFVPADPDEFAAVERVLAALAAGDAWSRDLPLHVTASALVVHPPTRRLLLRWHARLGGWFQVGGHGDPGESDPWMVALREAEEETGLNDLTAMTPGPGRQPVQVVVVQVPAAKGEPAHEHTDIRFALATSTPSSAQAESPDAPLRWFTFAEASATVSERNLHVLFARVNRFLR